MVWIPAGSASDGKFCFSLALFEVALFESRRHRKQIAY
jgi:hypothetical protein